MICNMLRIFLLTMISALGLMAQGPRVHNGKLPGTDWVPLFNGKDLKGCNEMGKGGLRMHVPEADGRQGLDAEEK